MKIYKCKLTAREGWTEITSPSPIDAAEIYAEEHGLEQGEHVSVWGIGIFKVHYILYEPVYGMKQITGKRDG